MTHPNTDEIQSPQGPSDAAAPVMAPPIRIELEIEADFTPEEGDGDAFDAVVGALDFAEIPAVVRAVPKGRPDRFSGAREPMAAINIEHLSEETLALMQVGGPGCEGLVWYPNEFGAFLLVDHFLGSQVPWPSSWPADLVTLMQMARDDALQWIKLDADAPRIEGVPLYPRSEGEDSEPRRALCRP